MPKSRGQNILKREVSRKALMLYNVAFTKFDNYIYIKDTIKPNTLSRIKDLLRRYRNKRL